MNTTFLPTENVARFKIILKSKQNILYPIPNDYYELHFRNNKLDTIIISYRHALYLCYAYTHI